MNNSIKKIIFTTDFLSHDFYNNATYHYWIIFLMKDLIFKATNINIYELKETKFSREDFFYKSSIINIKDKYYIYDINSIKSESLKYLNNFIDSESLIIGVELGKDIRYIFDKLNIVYINFAFHPYKLFDDIIFLMNTNNLNIFDKLIKYKVAQDQFYFYANYWKNYINEKKIFDDSSILSNSVLFVGQTSMDISVKSGELFLNIINYKEHIEDIAKNYSKIYYVPHPLENIPGYIKEYIDSVDYIEILYDVPTYYLLSSYKIKKVISISSSVLYEAQFFNKEIEYLYKPLYLIDEEYSIDTFISIYNDYFNAFFWSDILSPIINTNKKVNNKNLFINSQNKVRNIRDLYWGYKFLDNNILSLNHISDKLTQLEKHYNEKISNLEKYYNEKIFILENNYNNKLSREEFLKTNLNKFIRLFGIYNNANYIYIYFFGIRFELKMTDEYVKKVSWWIPIKKWRENFRDKFKIRPDQTRPDQTRPDQT